MRTKRKKKPAAMSPKERAMLRLIAVSISALGVQPTYRELMGSLGFTSPGSIQRLVHLLEEKGVVQRTGGGQSRGLIFKWQEYL